MSFLFGVLVGAVLVGVWAHFSPETFAKAQKVGEDVAKKVEDNVK